MKLTVFKVFILLTNTLCGVLKTVLQSIKIIKGSSNFILFSVYMKVLGLFKGRYKICNRHFEKT